MEGWRSGAPAEEKISNGFNISKFSRFIGWT